MLVKVNVYVTNSTAPEEIYYIYVFTQHNHPQPPMMFVCATSRCMQIWQIYEVLR